MEPEILLVRKLIIYRFYGVKKKKATVELIASMLSIVSCYCTPGWTYPSIFSTYNTLNCQLQCFLFLLPDFYNVLYISTVAFNSSINNQPIQINATEIFCL